MLVLIAMVGSLSLAVTSVMLRPLARFSAATKRMATGDLEQRVRVDSDDELGQLSKNFNAMAAQLETQDFPLRRISMDAYLQRIGNTLRPALEQKGILRVRATEAVVLLEPDLMETVCLNLLDNARKAIDGSGIIVLEGLVERKRDIASACRTAARKFPLRS